jgi:transcriptional regulator with XRE-family HTH domain
MHTKKQKTAKEVVKILPDRIKTAREAAGLTTLQLSKILGKSKTWLSFLETGKRKLHRHDLEQIAKTLRKPVVWFMAEDVEKDGLLWKARQYDRLMKEVEKFCSIRIGKHYTEVNEDELDQELERLGITDSRFKALFKTVPVMSEGERESVLRFFSRT